MVSNNKPRQFILVTPNNCTELFLFAYTLESKLYNNWGSGVGHKSLIAASTNVENCLLSPDEMYHYTSIIE